MLNQGFNNDTDSYSEIMNNAYQEQPSPITVNLTNGHQDHYSTDLLHWALVNQQGHPITRGQYLRVDIDKVGTKVYEPGEWESVTIHKSQ